MLVNKTELRKIISVLNLIKGECERIECTDCPFRTDFKGRAQKICFFTYPHEGRIPMEWDIVNMLERTKEDGC